MPVPQTFTSGAFRLPCPAPSPRTACPSMYAFWLMSSFAFLTKAPDTPQRRKATKNVAEFMSE